MLLKNNLLPRPKISYSKLEIMKSILTLQNFLPEFSSLIYSLKANNYQPLVDFMSDFTQGFDICSQEEIDILIQSNISGKDIFITGYDKVNIQHSSLLKLSSSGNTLFFVLESVHEISFFKYLVQSGINGKGLFRLSYMPGTNYGIYNGLPKSHFGMTKKEIIDCLGEGGYFYLKNIVGFHCYIGSQIQSIDSMMISLGNAVDEIREICLATDFQPDVVNFGGGFPHSFGSPYKPLSCPEISLTDSLRHKLNSLCHPPKSVFFESGRGIVGSSGRLEVSLLDYNINSHSPYLVINAGISQIGALHLVRSLRPSPMIFYGNDEQPADINALQKFDVYGPACTSLDHAGTAYLDPALISELQTLYCDNMGAYTASAALNGFHAKARINEELT